MNLFGDNIRTGAEFSPCRKYRYALWRIWDVSKPLAMFIGLNPSTANESKPDPTIQRVTAIVNGWDFGGFYMTNLFTIISPYPEVLRHNSRSDAEDDRWLVEVSEKCHRIVFAWGNFKEAEERAKQVIAMFPDAYALHINKNGSPKHPLYCRADSALIPFTQKTKEQ